METITREDGKRVLRVHLPADSELVIRVPWSEGRCASSLKLQTPGGIHNEPRVEVYGAPLQPDVRYHLIPGMVYSVFAWSSGTVEVAGSALLIRNVMRSSTRSITRPIVEYHCLTQDRRSEAEKLGTIGPVTVICGRRGLTKSVVARSLCNYAARAGWKPLFVDLDCGELQTVGIPGTVGAAVIDFPLASDDVVAMTHVAVTFFVGATEPQRAGPNTEMVMSPQYVNFSNALMSTVRERLQQQKGGIYASSGAVVVLPELCDNSAVNYIVDLVQQYGVTGILTIGDDYLFHKLLARLSTAQGEADGVQVDKLSQSYVLGGVLQQEVLLPLRFEEFFLGTGAVSLLPSNWLKRFEKLEVLQLREDGDQVVCVNVERSALQGIVGCIAALFKISKEESPLNSTPIAYARVQAVDAVGVTFFTTTHYTYPSEKLTAVIGSVRWITSGS